MVNFMCYLEWANAQSVRVYLGGCFWKRLVFEPVD